MDVSGSEAHRKSGSPAAETISVSTGAWRPSLEDPGGEACRGVVGVIVVGEARSVPLMCDEATTALRHALTLRTEGGNPTTGIPKSERQGGGLDTAWYNINSIYKGTVRGIDQSLLGSTLKTSLTSDLRYLLTSLLKGCWMILVVSSS